MEGTPKSLFYPEKLLRRNYFYFHCSLAFFVIISSFLYGLVHGLSKRGEFAQASLAEPVLPLAQAINGPEKRLLPSGVLVLPVGKNASINGRRSAMLTFVSERQVKDLLSEQVAKWESQGMLAFGAGSRRRGVAMSLDKASGIRQVMNVWQVKQKLQASISNGMPVQGVLSIADNGLREQASETEKIGLLPGVPPYPGGKTGVVFSSQEGAQRSYSVMYRNPGGLKENLAFYRQELGKDGWHETAEAPYSPGVFSELGSLSFERGKEELVMLFSPVMISQKTKHSQGRQTQVFVTLGPKWDILPR